jgi:RNA polymerase sigma-70 factor (ECF subfamily)
MEQNKPKTEEFIQLLSSNHYRIFAFIRSLVINDSDADDIMQDCSTMMWKKFNEFQLGTDFVAWGITIAKYRILEYQKKNKEYALSEETLNLLAAQSEKMMPELDRRLHALQNCHSKLSDRDKDILKLRYTYSYSGKMIARRIGTTVDTVYQHMSRIKTVLINCIQKQLRILEY